MTPIYLLSYALSLFVLKVFMRLKVIHLAPLPQGALVICCNHVHALDPFALAMITRRMVHYLAKKEISQSSPLLRWYLRSMGVVSVDRDGNDVKAMREMLGILKEGKAIGIFPEGHRYTDGQVHDFHPGAAMFALRSEAKLIPVGIYATFRPFVKTRLVVGEPMDLSEYRNKKIDSEDIRNVNERLKTRVMQLAAIAKSS